MPLGIAQFRYLMVCHALFCLNRGGPLAGQKSAKMDIGAHYFLNYSPKLENLDPSPPKPQNIDIGQSFDSNWTIESPKKGPARAILLLSNFSKFHQSNVARAGPFFGLSIAQLLSNDCPTSIFWGLGVDGSRLSRLGLKLWKQWGPMSILAHFWPVKDPPY